MEGVSSGVRDATEIDGKHGWRVAAENILLNNTNKVICLNK